MNNRTCYPVENLKNTTFEGQFVLELDNNEWLAYSKNEMVITEISKVCLLFLAIL